MPAWAPVGQQYAEWYWQNQQDPNGATYAYHRENYGENFDYDDFIPHVHRGEVRPAHAG